MPYYRSVGEVPRKRHTVAPSDEGRRSEELMGQEGFAEESSLLYHRHSPSALSAVEVVDEPSGADFSADLPLTPRHIRTGGLPAGRDVVFGRQPVLGNPDVVLCWAAATEDSDLYRNAIGDELVYIHDGEATLETSFGALPVTSGDYVVIPRGTTHRWVLGGDRLDV
ncbi:MAG TPA: homogentisate 1,2-dioxygenase, partial [Acidimicrobiales bacterium]|nr:homogentisate 1,2-dioxygenase [Acidimicrobiales bacterium]